MTTKIYCVSITILFLLFSCKKKEEPSFNLQITITDLNTALPIENAKVTLSSKNLEGSTYSSSFTLLNSVLSNSSGNVSFNTKYSTVIEFKVETELTNYINSVILLYPDDLSKEESNEISLPIQSTANVNISIKNQFPLNNQDEIFFSSTVANCTSCINVPALTLSGMQIDTSFSGLIPGNQYFKYSYITKKNNITTHYTDSSYCQIGTQSNVIISF